MVAALLSGKPETLGLRGSAHRSRSVQKWSKKRETAQGFLYYICLFTFPFLFVYFPSFLHNCEECSTFLNDLRLLVGFPAWHSFRCFKFGACFWRKVFTECSLQIHTHSCLFIHTRCFDDYLFWLILTKYCFSLTSGTPVWCPDIKVLFERCQRSRLSFLNTLGHLSFFIVNSQGCLFSLS